MSEPTTVLTDYALAVVALVLAARIASVRPRMPRAARLWAASFVALAVAAVVGGTWHAIPHDVLPSLRYWMWSITYVAIGLADLLLLAGAAQEGLSGWPRRAALALIAGRFLAYAAYVVAVRSFGAVALEFGLTLTCLLAFGLDLARRREPGAAFVLGGVATTFAAGLVLALRLSLHPRFNHNDLFHVIQIAGIWLLFRGALLLRDVGSSSVRPSLARPAAATPVL